MSIVSSSFTAVGTSAELNVPAGAALDLSVSGTFVATVLLERSETGGYWNQVGASITTAATRQVVNESPSAARYRLRCSAFTSGTAVSSIADANLKSEKRIVNAAGQAKAGTTAGWVVAAANNIALVTLPASQTASTLVVPIPSLKVGERITGFHLVGQIESGGNTATVDASLRVQTAAAADVTDALVASITQLSVTADAVMSESNTRKSGLDQVVTADQTYYVLITSTTALATDVALQAVAIEVSAS
jgi:hypothetical protein